MSGLPDELGDKLRSIRLLVLDVDGVLTDGTLYYGEQGEVAKGFNVRDGLGMRLLMENGVDVAVITARDSPPLTRRMTDLGVRHFHPGRDDKGRAIDELMTSLGLAPEAVAYVGDDLIDLAAFARVGLAITVADGAELVKHAAAWVTRARGGQGAVREVADAILECQIGLGQVCADLLDRNEEAER